MKAFYHLILGFGICLAFSAGAETNAPTVFRLKGTVVNPAGQPVDGATIEMYESSRITLFKVGEIEAVQRYVATNGTFDLELPPQGALIRARKPGLAPAWRTFWNVVSDVEGRFVLSQPTVLAGKVVDEADKPVAGAEVYVIAANMQIERKGNEIAFGHLTDKHARNLFTTRTLTDGRFRIEGFPTNTSAALNVEISGKTLRRDGSEFRNMDELPWQAGQEDIRLVAEPAGTVEGKIVVQEQSQSVPTAQLIMQPDQNGFFVTGGRAPVESRADGIFRISDMPAGNYRLRATFGTNAVPDWVAELVPVSVEPGKTNAGVQVAATRGGLLEVAVVGKKDHDPLEKVSVNVYKEGYHAAASTGKDGIAILRLPPGDFQLLASRDTSRAENTTVAVEAGKTNRVEVELPSPLQIRGMVRRPDGQPAVGAEVRIVNAYGHSGATPKVGADGKFEIPLSSQRSSGAIPCLLVRDPERNLAVAQEIDEETGPLDLKLAPGMTITGRAECGDAPVTNTAAALVFWSGNSGMHLYGMAVGTNVPGRFEIPALPTGRRYGLYVSAPGYSQKYINATQAQDEPTKLEVDPVELKPANLKLAGQVVDDNDKPVGGANVHLGGEGQPNANTTTDRQGRFSFKSVCEGAVRLSAYARNMNGSLSAEGGDTNVVIKLGESSSSSYSSGSKENKLKGIVTDSDGRPVSGAQVAVFPSPSGWVKTATNGAFSVNWRIESWQLQQGGDPWLVVRDLARNLAAAENISEETTNLNVRLEPAMTLTGRVEDSDGAALTNAEIGMWLLACRSYSSVSEPSVRVDQQGRFEIKTLPFGPQYIVYASAKDHGRSQQEIEFEPGTNRLELPPFVLKLADQVIAGQVLNEKEKPASGVQVSLSGDGQPQGSATTDKQGRFRFKVCEGKIRLYANGDNSYCNVSAEAGDTNLVLQLRGYSSSSQPVSKRASLKGKPLPDLAAFGLAFDAAPAGKPALVCLLDAEQRPSRRSARLLSEQHEALRQKGLAVLAIQAAAISAETLQTWTNASPLPFPLGRAGEKSANTKWAIEVESLPWLILLDGKGSVAAEGFSLDELDAKLDELKK